jgi:hypothetical protein
MKNILTEINDKLDNIKKILSNIKEVNVVKDLEDKKP